MKKTRLRRNKIPEMPPQGQFAGRLSRNCRSPPKKNFIRFLIGTCLSISPFLVKSEPGLPFPYSQPARIGVPRTANVCPAYIYRKESWTSKIWGELIRKRLNRYRYPGAEGAVPSPLSVAINVDEILQDRGRRAARIGLPVRDGDRSHGIRPENDPLVRPGQPEKRMR
jgi:hypothetical protein